MKKRIFALFMASLMAMSMVACGSKADDNSKEAEALLAEIETLKSENESLKSEDGFVGEKETTSNIDSNVETVEETVEENNGSLWGTKRPISATLKSEGSGVTYDGSFEYNDDGSYVAIYRHDASSYSEDHKYFYKSNGILYRTEHWRYDKDHPDGELTGEDFCMFGQMINYDSIIVAPFGVMCDWALQNNLEGVEFSYDEEGNINNPEGPLKYTDRYLSHMSPDREYYIEYDEQGRVSKFTAPINNSNDFINTIDIQYPDNNTVDIVHYNVETNGYDSATRSYGEVIHYKSKHLVITFNEYGVPQYLCGMVDDKEGNKWEYVYDEYGFATSILKDGQAKTTIEYVYE